jgi:hypothetical protein
MSGNTGTISDTSVDPLNPKYDTPVCLVSH